ncbi:MAG: hypothetical protein JNJ54_25900 [Myxococcaceae bacterium]|nr:hypothetical protein [Myxococcaceae bacterium]
MLFWDAVPMVLSYKDTLSFLVEDLIGLLERLASTSAGELTIAWPSNGFRSDWSVTWHSGRLVITATWHDLAHGIERLEPATLQELSIADFTAEWQRPLKHILAALEAAGYRALPGTKGLRGVIAGPEGRLYRHHHAPAAGSVV